MQVQKETKQQEWHSRYKRTYKIHVPSLFKAAKDNKEFELYCLFISLHSLTKDKVLRNYKSDYERLSKSTGFSINKLKKLIPILLQKKFAILDWNEDHLRLATKLFPLEYFGETTYGDMPHHAAKFITIETDTVITPQLFQALTIYFKQEQKSYACAKKFIESKVNTERKIKMVQILSLKDEYLKKIANFELNNNIYLDEIAQLFNYADRSGASKLIHKLKNLNYIKIIPRHECVREQNEGEFIDPIYSTKTKCINGGVYIQHANFTIFNFPFFINQDTYAEFNNSCVNKFIHINKLKQNEIIKKSVNIINKKLYWKMGKTKTTHKKEYFIDDTGKCCGMYTYTEIKTFDMNKETWRVMHCNKRFKLWDTFAASIRERYSSMDGINWSKSKQVEISYKKLRSFLFLHGRKLLTMTNDSYSNILKSMDYVRPVEKTKGGLK